MKRLNKCVLAVAVGVCATASLSAMAEPVLRDYTINAAGNCNGALPSFEGALRKRPTAIANEGASSAFVTCSLAGNFLNDGNNVVVAIFTNNSAAEVSFNCTFVDGYSAGIGGGSVFNPQTVTIAAGMPGAVIWEPAEGELFSNNANVSCALPAGVEINALEIQFEEDNGVEPPAP